MNTNILTSAMKEYFNVESSIQSDKYDLYIKILNKRKSIFGLSILYQVNVLVILYTNEIPFQEIANCVEKRISDVATEKKYRTICNWFVCSEQGGIYLYEAISTKENVYFKNMKNIFTIFNTCNGNVSFGPGHVHNMVISEKIGILLEQYRILEKKVWLNKLFNVFDLCFSIANGGRLFFR